MLLRRGAGRSDAYWWFSESQHTESVMQVMQVGYVSLNSETLIYLKMFIKLMIKLHI